METKARYGCRDFLLDARGRRIRQKEIPSVEQRVPCSHGYILFKQREKQNIREEVLIDDLIPTAGRIF